ncbi:hypothetical protein PSTT_04345, partial [Puccinia striiformis]
MFVAASPLADIPITNKRLCQSLLFYIILLACSALRYTLASPIGDLDNFDSASHVATMDSPLPWSPIQYTPGGGSQLRHRKLHAPKPVINEDGIP